MTFSAYMPSIKEIQIGTKYVLNGLNNENYKLFADAYDDSVTNSACINDISNLIKGEGLINANGGKSPSSIISDDDWGLLVLDYKKQGQCSGQVIWYDGKPVKIYHIPLENTGLNVDESGMKVNGYWYCYDWKKQHKYKPVFYPKFDKENPENKTQMFVIKRPSNEPLFARPDWFPALRWAQDEGLMAQHSYNDVATGFSGQKVVNWAGGRGLTDAQKEATKQEIKDKFSGINGQRLIVSINNSPENSVVVDNIDPPNVNATYINYTEEAERKILIAHSYPSILLAGSKTGFSSNADEIAVATKSTYRRVVNPARRTLLSPLQEIFDVIGDDIVLAVKDFESEELDNNTNQIQKFEQERDERGRFGSGNGGEKEKSDSKGLKSSAMTKEVIDKHTDELEKTFDKMGLFPDVSKSQTRAGNSNYITLYENEDGWMNRGFNVKIRISDHTTTNTGRVTGERHFDGSAEDKESLIKEMKRVFNKK